MKSTIHKFLAYGCALACVILAAAITHAVLAGNGSMLSAAAAVVTLTVFAIGLLRLQRWALRTAAAAFLLAAVILPVGIFSPFIAGDVMLTGNDPPTIGMTLAWLIPVESLLLGVVFLLDPKG